MNAVRKAVSAWQAAEKLALAALVLAMVLLSAAQIVMRNFLGTGIGWAEPVLGTSVLWIAMLGALAAAGARKHISIDAVAHFVPARLRPAMGAVTDLFSAAVCGLLARAALRYVLFLREAGETLFLAVPVWAAYSVMPAVFALIAARLFLQGVLSACEPLRRGGAEEGGR